MKDRILRATEAAEKVGLKKSSFYDLVRKTDFPLPLKLVKRSSGWSENEIDAWLQQKIKEKNSLDRKKYLEERCEDAPLNNRKKLM